MRNFDGMGVGIDEFGMSATAAQPFGTTGLEKASGIMVQKTVGR